MPAPPLDTTTMRCPPSALLDEPGQERNPVQQLEADFAASMARRRHRRRRARPQRALQRLLLRDVFVILPAGAMQRLDA